MFAVAYCHPYLFMLYIHTYAWRPAQWIYNFSAAVLHPAGWMEDEEWMGEEVRDGGTAG